MAWPFRVDHSSVEHPREPHCIIALSKSRRLIKIKTRSISTGETYDIDEFLDLAYALRSDLAHLEGHECAELIALQQARMRYHTTTPMAVSYLGSQRFPYLANYLASPGRGYAPEINVGFSGPLQRSV